MQAFLRRSLFVLLLGWFTLAHAAVEPQAFIKTLINEVVADIRKDPSLKSGDAAALSKYIAQKINGKVDTRLMTASAVGPSWREASDEQKQQLEAQFTQFLIRTYNNAFKHANEEFELSFPVNRTEASDKFPVVKTIVKTKGADDLPVDYRLKAAGDTWQIIDVNVLGVWLVQNYRTSFKEEIQKSGIDGLIASLKAKNQSANATPAKAASK